MSNLVGDVKQMSRKELESLRTLEALNELLDRNSRVAAAMLVIRKMKAEGRS